MGGKVEGGGVGRALAAVSEHVEMMFLSTTLILRRRGVNASGWALFVTSNLYSGMLMRPYDALQHLADFRNPDSTC